MKEKVKNFLKSGMFLFLLAFFLGCLCHYFISSSSDSLASDKKIINDDFKIAFGLNEGIGDQLEVKKREDDDYKYFEIQVKTPYKDALKINISNGLINIQSEVQNTRREERGNISTFSAFSSSLNQSFSVPEGVDEKRALIINEDNNWTIKFPKEKLML